ncbi:hypothetical protein K1X76_10185 [bacterium]|nr:hypothetical protein [bacterium]
MKSIKLVFVLCLAVLGASFFFKMRYAYADDYAADAYYKFCMDHAGDSFPLQAHCLENYHNLKAVAEMRAFMDSLNESDADSNDSNSNTKKNEDGKGNIQKSMMGGQKNQIDPELMVEVETFLQQHTDVEEEADEKLELTDEEKAALKKKQLEELKEEYYNNPPKLRNFKN